VKSGRIGVHTELEGNLKNNILGQTTVMGIQQSFHLVLKVTGYCK